MKACEAGETGDELENVYHEESQSKLTPTCSLAQRIKVVFILFYFFKSVRCCTLKEVEKKIECVHSHPISPAPHHTWCLGVARALNRYLAKGELGELHILSP